MSGFGGLVSGDTYTKPDFGITRNRKTHVVFNDPREYLLEPTWVMERLARDIGRTTQDKPNSMKLILIDDCWVVRNLWSDESLTIERNEASGGLIGAAAGALGTYVSQVNTWRKPSNTLQSGVLTSASPNINTTGGPMLVRNVPTGSDWSTGGLPDGVAYTFPSAFQSAFVSDNAMIMERSYVGNTNDKENRDLKFTFWVPGSSVEASQLILQFGFVGPATGAIDGQSQGLGQYCIQIYGNGIASLFEKRADSSWVMRMWFRYGTVKSTGSMHSIEIYKVGYASVGKFGISGYMKFVCSDSVGLSVEGNGVDWSYNKHGTLSSTNKSAPVYYASCMNTKPPTQEAPVRVSCRIDLRLMWSIYGAIRPSSAVLQDDNFSLPFYPRTIPATTGDDGVLTLYWFGDTPSGCSIEGKLYRADTGAELTALAGGSGANYKSYAPALNVCTYYAKFTFTTNGVDTPTLQSYSVARPSVTMSSTEVEDEFSVVRGISLVGTERDPKHESANVVISNLNNDATLLRTRGSIPFRVEIEWQPDVDTADRCVLFKGFTGRVTAKRRTKIAQNTAAPRSTADVFYEYQVQGTGMYQALREQVNPYNRRLWNDAESLPFKVTDVLRDLLLSAGFTSSQIDIDDLPIRAFGHGGSGAAQTLDILADLGQTIFGLQNKYLGHFILYDPNSGTAGQWVLVAPPVAPYTNKAEFVFSPEDKTPAPSGVVLTNTSRLSYVNATTPTGFIRKGSMTSWVKPPEGNVIIVSAFRKTTPNSVPTHLYQVFPNFKSFDFGNGLVDPDHPDYLGRMVPIYVMVPEVYALSELHPTESGMFQNPALNWIGRRIYDVAAHAVKFVTFEAPLILVDEENPVTYEKRPLRYYDPVLVDGEQFLIRNVNPTYRKDYHQMAVYECEAPRT